MVVQTVHINQLKNNNIIMRLFRYNDFISEKVATWKRSWVKEDSTREIGSIYQPYEILEYVTTFHSDDSYDDTDFYERLEEYDHFILKMVDIEDLDLDEYQLDEDKVEDYIEDYKNEGGQYPSIVIGEIEYGYTIIDGLHRSNALHEMGMDKIRAYVGINKLNESIDISSNFIEDTLDTHEGFNSREDAKEYLDDMLEYYNGLDDIITLYRVIFLENKEDLDESFLGNHWTPEKHLMTDKDWLKRIREVNDSSYNEKEEYIIEAEFYKSDVNWEWTIHTNISFPYEEEIMINDNKNPIRYEVYSIEEFKNR